MGNNTEILSLRLNYASSLPLFLQAAHLLKRKISEGKFTSVQKFPTVKELSNNSHIPATVIEQAYKILAEKAVLGYEKERGYFLLEPSLEPSC